MRKRNLSKDASHDSKRQTGVILKPGREQSVLNRHHWIFSGAIQSYPDHFIDGEIYSVLSSRGELLGQGYFNRRCSLAGRLISFGHEDPNRALKESLAEALKLRLSVYQTSQAFRLVNGESDNLPGLVVDSYGSGLVIQVSTLGMENLKPLIIEELVKVLKPEFIYEKSLLPSRKEEGLEDSEGLLYGRLKEPILIEEQGIKFKIYLSRAQKTGFFLDQREMRQLVRHIASGKKVLDGFSYTGGFSLAALKGGALQADLVDVSPKTLEMARENLILNGFSEDSFRLVNEDMFDFLEQKEKLDYGLIILDPPAFAKKKADLKAATKAYRQLNRLAMEKMQPGSFLITFSCSYYIDNQLFQKIIFQSALEAGREVKILQRHRQSFDHPVSIFHPESDYLKGFLLYVV